MKVVLYENEEFPVYSIHEPASNSVGVIEVPDETLARWREVIAAYADVQAEMGVAYDGRFRQDTK